jgi:hypothetical protein
MITISMIQNSTPKSNQKLTKKNNTTVIFGYGLFLLTILNVILSTVIPLGNALFHPTARHFNIVVMLITFVAAAILPALGSYILGDRATHIKNKALHHYNGILFGLAAYWVASALSWIGFNQFVNISESPTPLTVVITNGVPIILTIAVMAFVAITYAKKQKNKSSVLEHRPYQIALIGSIIALYLSIAMDGNYSAGDAIWTSVLSYAFPVVLTIVSYRILAKYHSSWLARLMDAVVAMSISHITLSSIGPFTSYLYLPWIATMIWSYVFALGVWIAYLYLRNRKNA